MITSKFVRKTLTVHSVGGPHDSHDNKPWCIVNVHDPERLHIDDVTFSVPWAERPAMGAEVVIKTTIEWDNPQWEPSPDPWTPFWLKEARERKAQGN